MIKALYSPTRKRKNKRLRNWGVQALIRRQDRSTKNTQERVLQRRSMELEDRSPKSIFYAGEDILFPVYSPIQLNPGYLAAFQLCCDTKILNAPKGFNNYTVL